MQKETVVSKTSYGWSQLLFSILSQARTKDKTIVTLSPQQVSQIRNKGLLLLAIVSLWWWNWQLLLATSVGISLMWLSYKLSLKQKRRLWHKTLNSLTGHNRRLLFAVSSGSIGGFITYLATAIWVDTENHWLATGSILQGLATIATLVLLGRHLNNQQSDRNSAKFEQLLGDLTASDSLKRLIAIRQLTSLVRKKAVDREHHLQLIEYFNFMLLQPQDSTIQSALVDSLAILEGSNLPLSPSHSIKQPISLKHSVTENVL